MTCEIICLVGLQQGSTNVGVISTFNDGDTSLSHSFTPNKQPMFADTWLCMNAVSTMEVDIFEGGDFSCNKEVWRKTKLMDKCWVFWCNVSNRRNA